MHLLVTRLSVGASLEEVLRTTRPPIFFKQQDSFRRQLTLWTEARLRPQLDRIAAAELNTTTPSNAI
jgi:DNA polymerase-3 subunit delta